MFPLNTRDAALLRFCRELREKALRGYFKAPQLSIIGSQDAHGDELRRQERGLVSEYFFWPQKASDSLEVAGSRGSLESTEISISTESQESRMQ